MPLPMNSTAKRFGNVPAAVAVTAACAGLAHAIDSIHGRAMVTPMPRRTVRLEIVPLAIALPLCSEVSARTFVAELRAGHDAFHQAVEPIAVFHELRTHAF